MDITFGWKIINILCMKLVAINPCLFYADDDDFLGQDKNSTE